MREMRAVEISPCPPARTNEMCRAFRPAGRKPDLEAVPTWFGLHPISYRDLCADFDHSLSGKPEESDWAGGVAMHEGKEPDSQ